MYEDLRGLQSVLVVVAHPDDAEFGMAGTIAKFAESGADVRVCLTTNGASGSNDPSFTRETLAARRKVEQENASASLGVKEVIWLGYEDGYLTPSIELRRDITRQIRRLRPDAVLTMDPTRWYAFDRYINHPDHRATGEACLGAIMPSSDTRLVFTELLDEGLEPHKVKEVWLSNPAEANHYIDIEPYMDRKIAALLHHETQVGENVGEFVEQRAKLLGEAGGFVYAEAFRTFSYR